MQVRKAIIPLAGLGTRLYPVSITTPKGLMPFVLPDGTIKTGLQLILETLLSAGIEQVALVISRDSLSIYRNYFSGYPERYTEAWETKPALKAIQEQLSMLESHCTYIFQEEPLGLGHAIRCASEFATGEAVLVALGDHLYLHEKGASCTRQILDAFETLQATVIGVHRVGLEDVELYGVIKGVSADISGVYQVERLIEKPSREEAMSSLRTKGLNSSEFFAHFGLFAFTPALWQVMERIAQTYHPAQGEWQLATAEQHLIEQETCYAFEIAGMSLDYGVPEGYREAFRQVSEAMVGE
jgi:UTP--glucose-1-phosphate uridylyltransferase